MRCSSTPAVPSPDRVSRSASTGGLDRPRATPSRSTSTLCAASWEPTGSRLCAASVTWFRDGRETHPANLDGDAARRGDGGDARRRTFRVQDGTAADGRDLRLPSAPAPALPAEPYAHSRAAANHPLPGRRLSVLK